MLENKKKTIKKMRTKKYQSNSIGKFNCEASLCS